MCSSEDLHCSAIEPYLPFQMEEELFNPDYIEVDRVLEVSYCEDKDTGEVWI